MVVVDIKAAASTVLFLLPAIDVLEAIDAAELIVRILLFAAEVLAEILVLGRPNLTLLTASAMMVVTEAAISEVRTRLASRLVVAATEPETSAVRIRLATNVVPIAAEADAVAFLTRTASTAVVMAIDPLAEASTILASKAASGADARGLKPSID